MKPIAGFTFNEVPSRSAGLCRLLNGARYGSIACSGSFEVIIHLKKLKEIAHKERYPTYRPCRSEFKTK